MLLPFQFKLIAGSSASMVVGVLFGFIIFPSVLKSQIKKQMSLSPKTDVRKMWEKVPFPLDFKIYVFNYTNAEEVQKGALPIVREIGPYMFDEWKEKVQVKDDEENDTISFRRQDTFIFRPDKSNGLNGDEEVVLPNLFLMTLATMTLRERPGMMNVLGKAIHGIFDNPPTVFTKVKVMDLLFRGVNINCDRKEFAPKATCTALKKEAADSLIFEPGNQYKFSIFGMQNSTPGRSVLTVKRGTENVMEVGEVISLNGERKQTMWRDHCNDIEGTDGTIFAPFLTPNDRLNSYAEVFCRPFKPWFEKKTSYAGISTNRYLANIGDLVNDPELKCFCKDPGSCTKGLMDLAPCSRAPLYISLPHYLDSDPKLVANVRGLSPDAERHLQFLDFEPLTGSPLRAKSRIMFSMQLVKSDKLDLLKTLPDTIAPIFWLEESLELSDAFTGMMKKQLFTPKKVVKIVSWLLVIAGLGGLIIGVVIHLKATASDKPISKISPQDTRKTSVTGVEMPAKISS